MNARSFFLASTLTAMTLIAAAMLIVGLRQAAATPQFSQQTSLPCTQCHANPAGGKDLKAFGQKFKANGNKVK